MPRFVSIFVVLLVFPLVMIACSSPQSEEKVERTAVVTDEATKASTITATAPTIAPPATMTAPAAESSYPGSAVTVPHTPLPEPYPPADETVSAYPPPDNDGHSGSNNETYLPIMKSPSSPPAAPSEPTPEPQPTVDFAAVQTELEAQGQDIGYVKTGFHVTLPEDRERLDDWMTRLDEAGVPIFLKTVDNAEPLFKAQELMRSSGVPHVLVYRSTGSVPHYELSPQVAAQHHWTTHRDLFPPELDPSLVWVETLNEPDRTQSEWLAQFALETARLAMADGFRWAAFGWSSGEPEPEHWRGPWMQEFLRLAAENPDQLAIALHEYSFLEEDIGHEYPFKIGRFQTLFEIADELGIPRPTVLITEWGWEHADIPPVEEAMDDLKWASKLYSAYPQVKGAAIWNLGIGCCFGDISEQVQEIIDPLTDFSLRKYYSLAPGQQPVNPAQFQP